MNEREPEARTDTAAPRRYVDSGGAELPGPVQYIPPNHEKLVGETLRVLRQGRGWSQRQVAEYMKDYGFDWQQTTVARIEAATRPLRLNEALNLAALFGVSLSDLLVPPPSGGGSFEAAEREMEALMAAMQDAVKRGTMARHMTTHAQASEAQAVADANRIRARMETLAKWHPKLAAMLESIDDESSRDAEADHGA